MTTVTHPADRLADWLAPALFGCAVGWSVWSISQSAAIGVAAGVGAWAAATLLMRRFGTSAVADAPAFQPAAFEDCLDDAELLLDDPLSDVGDDSRVVRLFAADEATPGELVARIEDYLGSDPRRTVREASESSENSQAMDASAALHAALANIRLSLR